MTHFNLNVHNERIGLEIVNAHSKHPPLIIVVSEIGEFLFDFIFLMSDESLFFVLQSKINRETSRRGFSDSGGKGNWFGGKQLLNAGFSSRINLHFDGIQRSEKDQQKDFHYNRVN